MKYLITGANGYLGRGIVQKLLDDGYEVIATDITTTDVDDRAYKIDCNLFEIENPYEFFKKPDFVLHLAWRDGFIHDSDKHIIDLPSHYIFIDKLLKNGLKKFGVMGSMHEVGFYEGAVKASTYCHPETMYGIAKHALRLVCENLASKYNASFQWLRGYYIVANESFGNSVFSKIVGAESNGQEFFPFTLGQNQYDFIDYDDFCLQVCATIQQDKVNGIINICSGTPEKLATRVEKFIKDNNFKIKLQYGAFPDRKYDSKAIWGDNKEISEILKEYDK